MTPPEKALRARLERVLMADAHAGGAARGISPDSGTKSPNRTMRSPNEVRDEAGAWPWRERDHDTVRVSQLSYCLFVDCTIV